MNFPTRFCFESTSEIYAAESREVFFKQNAHCFLVKLLNIHKYLMVKNNVT